MWGGEEEKNLKKVFSCVQNRFKVKSGGFKNIGRQSSLVDGKKYKPWKGCF